MTRRERATEMFKCAFAGGASLGTGIPALLEGMYGIASLCFAAAVVFTLVAVLELSEIP